MANWVIRRSGSGLALWTGPGGPPPDVVTDKALYERLFRANFPQIDIEFGGGEFDLYVTSPTFNARVAGIKAFRLPGRDWVTTRDQSPKPVLATEARIITPEIFEEEVRQASIPVVLSQAGDMAIGTTSTPVHTHVPDPPIPTPQQAPEAPDFLMLMRVLSKKCVLTNDQWAQSLQAVAKDAPKALDLTTCLLSPIPHGTYFLGLTQTQTTTVNLDLFWADPTPKTEVFLRWLDKYFTLETSQPSDPVQLYTVALQMAVLASRLYLLESKQACATPQDACTELQDMVQVLIKKSRDYGQSFRRHGFPSLLSRIWDKVSRYVTLKNLNTTPHFESLRDTAQDLLGYSVMVAAVLWEENQKGREHA